MSAWILSRGHIDAPVPADVQFGLITDIAPQKPAGLGADLWQENPVSVGHRCGGLAWRPDYPAPTATVVFDPVAVVRLIDCDTYRSCEHLRWLAGHAADYRRRPRDAVTAELPVEQAAARRYGAGPYPAGYDQAPWGIRRLGRAVAGTAGTASETIEDAEGRR